MKAAYFLSFLLKKPLILVIIGLCLDFHEREEYLQKIYHTLQQVWDQDYQLELIDF